MSDFTIEVGASLNTKNVEAQFENLKKTFSTKVIDLGDGYKQIETLTTYTNKAGESFKHLSVGMSDAKKSFVEIENRITEVSKGFNTMSNSSNSWGTATDRLNDYIDRLHQANQATAQSNAQTSTTVEVTNSWVNTLPRVSREEAEVANQNVQVTNSQNALTRAVAESIGVTEEQLLANRQISQSNNDIANSNQQNANSSNAVVQAQQRLNNANNQTAQSSQNLSNINNKLVSSNKNLGQSFLDVVKKVSKFYVATIPIQTFRKAINESITIVKEFDDAVTELAKVSTLSGQAISDYTEKLGKLGETVARTRTEMVQSATEFKKAGFTEEDSAQLAQLSSLYQNTADEELSASEATSVLVSQMKAFNYTAEDAIHITDAINKVSQDFAVSSADIGKGLTQAGASLQTYGNSFDQTVGLLTAGTEIFQGKSQQVARGLNQIANRVSKNEDALGAYGVKVKDVNGELRSTFDVLQDLKPQWDKMSKSEQVALGTTLAGTNQYKIFSAVMSNFNTAVKSSEESLNSAGTTMKQNEVYMQSLEAKVQALRTEFEKLVLGNDGILIKLSKLFVEIGTSLLKFANSDIGQLIIKFALLEGSIYLLVTNFTKLQAVIKSLGIIRLISDVSALRQGMVLATSSELAMTIATKGLTTALLECASAWLLSPMGIATVAVGGIYLIIKALTRENKTLEENANAIQETTDAFNEAQNEVESITNQLEDLAKSFEEIARKKKLVTSSEEINSLNQETKILLEQEKTLKRQLALAIAKAEVKKKKAHDSSKSALQDDDYEYTKYSIEDTTGVVKWDDKAQGDVYTALQDTINGYEQLKQKKEELVNLNLGYLDSEGKIREEYALEYENNESQIAMLESGMQYLAKQGVEYADVIESANVNLDTTNASEKALVEKGEELVDTFYEAFGIASEIDENLNFGDIDEEVEETTNELEEMAKALGITEKQLKKVSKQLKISAKDAYQFLSAVKEFNSNVDDLQSSYDALASAEKEYAENGALSLDTLQSLMEISPEYLGSLQLVNGELQFNKEILEQQLEAEKKEAEEIVYGIAIKQLQALIDAKVAEARQTSTNAINEETDALNKNSQAEYTNMVLKAYETGVSADEIQTIQNNVAAMTKAFRDSNLELGRTKSSARGAGSGLNEMESKVESLTSALEKQIEVLKKQKEEAVSAVEKQIKALQKEKDEAVKAIEKQIKALEREKEIREKYWEEQLKNLERENEEREKGLELQKKQEELARAQQTRKMVFKDGQFQYGADETEVSSAQQALFEQEDQNEYEKQKQLLEDLRDAEMEMYEQRIQTLEDYKEQVEEYYDQQIEALEEYKEQLEEEYDAQIEALELLKENITELYENLTEEEKAQLEALLNSETWFQDNSVSQWNSYFSRVQDAIKSGQNAVKGLLNGGIDGTGGYLVSTGANAISTGANYIGAYASGKGSIGDNQLAVVGENPRYREIVIGSKLNNDQGVLMNLKRGSGVVNAGATNTLASLFHQLGGNKQLNANNVSNGGTTISINNITLPEVKNGSDFVEYLQNFALDMTQKAYAR